MLLLSENNPPFFTVFQRFDIYYQWTYPSIAYEDTAYWPKRKLLTADFPKKNILKPHHALPRSTVGYTAPPWAPLTFDPNDKVMGYGSLKSTSDGSTFYHSIHLTPSFPVTNGDTVTLKAKVKGNTIASENLYGSIRCYQITGEYVDIGTASAPCDNTWKDLTLTGTVPQGTTSIDFFIGRTTSTAGSIISLNTAQLEVSSTPTEYQDPTLDTITQPINKLGEFNEPTTGTDTQTINTKIDIPEITETTTNQTIKTANNILEDINILDENKIKIFNIIDDNFNILEDLPLIYSIINQSDTLIVEDVTDLRVGSEVWDELNISDLFDRSFIFKDSRLFLHGFSGDVKFFTQNGDGVIRFWRRRLDD